MTLELFTKMVSNRPIQNIFTYMSQLPDLIQVLFIHIRIPFGGTEIPKLGTPSSMLELSTLWFTTISFENMS